MKDSIRFFWWFFVIVVGVIAQISDSDPSVTMNSAFACIAFFFSFFFFFGGVFSGDYCLGAYV